MRYHSLSFLLVALWSLLALPSRAQSASSFPGQPHWAWQNPRPTGAWLRDVAVLDDSTALAVGEYGTALKTTDRGLSWQRLDVGVTQTLKAVSFATAQVGWVGYDVPVTNGAVQNNRGPGEVRRTTDGGRTWRRQLLGENRSVLVLSLHALSASECYVLYAMSTRRGSNLVDWETQLRHTTNGGQTWTRVGTAPLPYFLYVRLQFVTPTVGYMVSGDVGHILKTQDGGLTWQEVRPSSVTNYQELSFTSARNGWVSSMTSRNGRSLYVLWHTTNGGQSWTADSVSGRGRYYVAFADSLRGYASGQFTTDGGQTWQLSTISPSGATISLDGRLRITAGGRGWAVGGSGQLSTTSDAGATWLRRDTILTNERLERVGFEDASHGWALGSGFSRLVVRTVDRGRHWQPLYLSVRAPGVDWPTAVTPAGAFPDRDTAYVAGVEHYFRATQQAFVLGTTDGGQNWQRQAFPATAAQPNDMAFRDGRRGVLVGDSGLVARTVDGGQTWTRVAAGTRADLNAVTWADATTLYAVGDSTCVLRSADGGQTWQRLPGLFNDWGSGRQLTSVAFVSAGTGTVMGWRTTDGGQSWTHPINDYYPGFLVRSPGVARYGWGLQGGAVWHTTDGGNTWNRPAVPYYYNANDAQYYLYGVAVGAARVDGYNGWLVGNYGAIVHYAEKFLQADTSASQRLAYCSGDTLTVAFDTLGTFSPAEQAFRLELSNPLGRFRPGQTTLLPLVAGSGAASPLRATLPATLAAGARYRVRVIRADSSVLGADNGRDLALSARPAAVAVTPATTQTLCQGDSVQLGAPAGYAAYRWSTGATTASIWVKTAGSYAVRVGQATSCLSAASAAVVVRVTPLPATPTLTATPQASGIVILTSSAASGNQWYLNGQPVPGATGATYAVTTGAQSGSYTVRTTANGCASAPSASQSVTVTGLAPDGPLAELTLHPNPANGQVQLHSGAGLATVTLLELTGRVVRRSAVVGGPDGQLPLAGVPNGAYLVRVTLADGRVLTRRLLVSH